MKMLEMKGSVARRTASVALLVVCSLPARSDGGAHGSPRDAATERARVSTATIPIHFEENRGQADPQVRYLWRGSRSTLFLAGEGPVLALHPEAGAPGAALRLTLAGDPGRPCIETSDELPGRVSYLRGSDPRRWIRSAATYARVRYAEVYPGIDLVLHGSDGRLEYDFVVRAGADPAAIRLRFEGAESTRLDASGNVTLSASGREVVQKAPVSYQVADTGRKAVASRAVLTGDEVGFELGDYDRSRELVIDPVLAFSTFLGGSGNDWSRGGVAVDASGYVYVTGVTESVNFPTTSGAFQETFQGFYNDAFVTKLDPTGSSLVYSTYLGGTAAVGADEPWDIAVDSAGNAYIGGETSSADFPTTPGAYDTSHNGGIDGFVAKLDASGSSLLYATFLGGASNDYVRGLVVDPTQNVYVVGSTSSTNFPTTVGAYDRTHNGGSDAFVTKLNPSGSALAYSTYLGGSPDKKNGGGTDFGKDVAVDASGNAYVVGYTSSANFPTTVGAYDRSLTGSGDGFVSKLNGAGSALVYSTFLGGSEGVAEDARAIGVDASGAAVVSGMTTASNFPTSAGAYDRSFNGGRDLFVTKLNAAGSGLVFSTFLGGSGEDGIYGQDLALDGTGAAYVASMTRSADFPTTVDALDSTLGGAEDAVIAKLNATGSQLLYGTYVGGGLGDWAYKCALGGSSLYVTGQTASQDFPVTPGAFQGTFQGDYGDAFVLRLDF